jgi:hypothetical protein
VSTVFERPFTNLGGNPAIRRGVCVRCEKGRLLSDPSTQPVLNRATVLVVDDEGLVRLMSADALRDQGYSVVEGHTSSLPGGLADGLFSKPYDPGAVAGKIENVLKAQAGALNRGRSGEVRSVDGRPFEFAA